MRVWQHLSIVLDPDIQFHALLGLPCSNGPRFHWLLVKNDNWLCPLVRFDSVFVGELLELIEHFWLLLNLLRELDHREPAIFESIFVQVL